MALQLPLALPQPNSSLWALAGSPGAGRERRPRGVRREARCGDMAPRPGPTALTGAPFTRAPGPLASVSAEADQPPACVQRGRPGWGRSGWARHRAYTQFVPDDDFALISSFVRQIKAFHPEPGRLNLIPESQHGQKWHISDIR